MTRSPPPVPRLATVADAPVVAALLDSFNREFQTPTPGGAVLAGRLSALLPAGALMALLVDDPAMGVAVLTLRPSLWFSGPVAVLDELYVVPEQRGAGLGSALLQAAEAAVLAKGGHLIEIDVDGADVDARRFYERHGYVNSEPGRRDPLLYFFRELDGEGA